MNSRLPKNANPLESRLLETVGALRGAVYLVGGAVRDALLGAPSKDADYLVTGVPLEELREGLAKWARVDLVGSSFGVLKLTFDSETVDVALPRTEQSTGLHHRDFQISADPNLSLETDLMRRDFTVNALARRLGDGELIDPFGGALDLERRVLRAVGDASERFLEDPLRMLRLARFIAKLEFTPDSATARAAADHAGLIGSVAPERIQTELLGLVSSRSSSAILDSLRFLRDTGLLAVIIPEFAPCIGFDQANPHHDLTLDEHIFQAVYHAATRETSSITRLALLLHDIGKPDRRSFGADGIAHYHHHEGRGADLARVILERLKFSNDDTDAVTALVANHMRPPRSASQRTLRRFKRDLGQLWTDALEVRLADRLAHAPDGSDPLLEYRRDWSALEELPAQLEGFTQAQLAVTGEELMRVFHLGAGREIGDLKRRAAEAVIEGEIENERDAILEYLLKDRLA